MKIFNLKYILSVLLISIGGYSYAQQQVMYTQYMFNGLAINPAYAGSQESLSLTALAREQWVGLDGAPSTQTFSAHSPLQNERVALGLLAVNDKIGITSQFGVYGIYAYRLPMPNGGKLSMAVQGGINTYNANFSDLGLADDPTFSSGDISETSPNFGAGIYYYTSRFYAGVSVPQLVENEVDKDNADSDSRQDRHYFINAGYVFDLSPSLKFKPNFLAKYVTGAPAEFDINANFLINELVWLGVSYRSFDSFDALFQIKFNESLALGYAYDFATTTELRRVNSGSHEIMISYRFAGKKTKVLTPRYF